MVELDLYTSVLFGIIDPSETSVLNWYTLNNVKYFVIQKFDSTDSQKITSGLNVPTKFIFSKNGNIIINGQKLISNGIAYTNPFTKSSGLPDTGTLHYNVTEYQNIYKYNSNNIISINLLWILNKDTTGIWRILYNPIHAKDFGLYYMDRYNNAGTNKANGLPGPSTSVTTPSINFQTQLTSYANSLIMIGEDGIKFYLDPTINMMTLKNAQYSYIFNNNIANRNETTLNNVANVLKTLGTFCYCPTKGIMPYIVGNNLTNPDSFILKMLTNLKPSITQCDVPMTFNSLTCSTIIASAHDTDTSGSKISNNCNINSDSSGGTSSGTTATAAPADDLSGGTSSGGTSSGTTAPADDSSGGTSSGTTATAIEQPNNKKTLIIGLIIVFFIIFLIILFFLIK